MEQVLQISLQDVVRSFARRCVRLRWNTDGLATEVDKREVLLELAERLLAHQVRTVRCSGPGPCIALMLQLTSAGPGTA